MKELVCLQQQLQNYLMCNASTINKSIKSTKQVSTKIRLDIYRDAYYSRLMDALKISYPALLAAIGETKFSKLAKNYIVDNPSTYRSIRWFGDTFASYIKAYLPIHYIELATLEWTLATVFDAADATPITLEDINQLPPDKWEVMQFETHPSIQRINLQYNVVNIWQALLENQKLPKPTSYAQTVPWILWRKDLVSQYCSMTQEEAWAIDFIRERKTFGELCEGLCKWKKPEEVGLATASLLKGWITAGLIVKIII